jgi:hypothetical protein
MASYRRFRFTGPHCNFPAAKSFRNRVSSTSLILGLPIMMRVYRYYSPCTSSSASSGPVPTQGGPGSFTELGHFEITLFSGKALNAAVLGREQRKVCAHTFVIAFESRPETPDSRPP